MIHNKKKLYYFGLRYIIDSFKSNKYVYMSEDDNYPKIYNLYSSQEKNKSLNVLNENKEQNLNMFEKEKEKDYEKVIKDALS